MFIDLLRKRRSIRKFQKRRIEKEKLDLLIEAALRAFASRGRQPCEFVIVTDPDMMDKLALSKDFGSVFLKNSPMAFVVCADPKKSELWVEDAAIPATLIHLAATDLGLGSCWVQIRLRDKEPQQSSSAYIAKLLNLREGLEVEAIVAVGYPAENKEGHTASSLAFELVNYESYGFHELH